MKKSKKHPRKQLENFSNIFMQLGLVLVLFVVFVTLEHQTEKESEKYSYQFPKHDDNTTYTISSFTKVPKRVEVKQVERKVIVKTVPLIKFKSVKDTPKAMVNEPNITVPDNAPVIKAVVPVVVKKDTEPSGPVSMNSVQKAPVFKGCEGLSEVENRKCFESRMKQLVLRNFNTELANELGLRSGKKRIMTQFVIDKNGYVTDVQIRAPHPKLKKEAGRILGKIPKLTPGVQNDKTVKVRYTLPISFMVE
ncbi:energy transducer TonB [Tenacibaculum sp. MEBiC06402]|uniref:energy transducer TonB n=1 Tax=unclassified Tenacibaculum TaxID=2635139 RepID=UPI003B9CFBBA